jgi:hypothetical protein
LKRELREIVAQRLALEQSIERTRDAGVL